MRPVPDLSFLFSCSRRDGVRAEHEVYRVVSGGLFNVQVQVR